MKKYRPIITALLSVILLMLFTSGTALAESYGDTICSAPSTAGRAGTCAENAEDAEPTPPSVPDEADVYFAKGEYTLYGDDGSILGTIKIAKDGDFAGTVTKADEEATEGNAKVQFLQSSQWILLETADEEGTELRLVPARITFTDAEMVKNSFDACVEWQCVINFDDLVIAYQGWHPILQEEPMGAEAINSPEPTLAPTASVTDTFDSAAEAATGEQAVNLNLSDVLTLIGIGICILAGVAILVAVILQTNKTRRTLYEIADSINDREKAEAENAKRIENVKALTGRQIEITAAIEQRLNSGIKVLAEPPHPRPDPLRMFQERVNGLTTVNEPGKWFNSLAAYQPAFLKYDAIQNWFCHADASEVPPLAICTITAGNGQILTLVPSCYNVKLSGDIQPAYDIVEPRNRSANIKRYQIDRLATIEPYGAYYRIISKGQISLIT